MATATSRKTKISAPATQAVLAAEQRGYPPTAVVGRDPGGVAPVVGRQRGVGAVLEQQPRQLRLIGVRGRVKGREAALLADVRIGAPLEQEPQALAVARGGGSVQGS